MGYSAKVLLDSVSPAGIRLTTMQITYPRFVHSEFMTHRVFSRNAASSRAIPIVKSLDAVYNDPVLPVWWGRNQSGMAAREELNEEGKAVAKAGWLGGSSEAIRRAEHLSSSSVDLHKQIVNRILEPFSWITVIVTATEWKNFFTLRRHEDAQPEIKRIADMMFEVYQKSKPSRLFEGEWHLPLILEEEINHPDLPDEEYGYLDLESLKRISVARCARVSYLTHDGKRSVEKDLELFERLLTSRHMSPFEHVATPITSESDAELKNLKDGSLWSGNFKGWRQYRKGSALEKGD